jgi:hypothetical protein
MIDAAHPGRAIPQADGHAGTEHGRHHGRLVGCKELARMEVDVARAAPLDGKPRRHRGARRKAGVVMRRLRSRPAAPRTGLS